MARAGAGEHKGLCGSGLDMYVSCLRAIMPSIVQKISQDPREEQCLLKVLVIVPAVH